MTCASSAEISTGAVSWRASNLATSEPGSQFDICALTRASAVSIAALTSSGFSFASRSSATIWYEVPIVSPSIRSVTGSGLQAASSSTIAIKAKRAIRRSPMTDYEARPSCRQNAGVSIIRQIMLRRNDCLAANRDRSPVFDGSPGNDLR